MGAMSRDAPKSHNSALLTSNQDTRERWDANTGVKGTGHNSSLAKLLGRTGGLDPTRTDADTGNTLWHQVALEYGGMSGPKGGILTRLLSALDELCVDPRKVNHAGRTPLHILSNIRPDFIGDGNLDRPGYVLLFDLLLDWLKDHDGSFQDTVNAADTQGITPLHLAVTSSEYQTRRLLAAGADLARADHSGRMALHMAALACESNVVGLLLEDLVCPNLNTDDHSRDETRDCDIPQKSNAAAAAVVNSKDACGRTALYYSCVAGSIGIFRLLVKAGAVTDASLHSRSSLEFASSCWHAIASFDEKVMQKNKHPRRVDEIVEFLLEDDPQLDVTVLDEAMAVAAARGSAYVFEVLERARQTFVATQSKLAKENIYSHKHRENPTFDLSFLHERQENRKEAENPAVPVHMRFLRLIELREYALATRLLSTMNIIQACEEAVEERGGQSIPYVLITGGFASMLAVWADAINETDGQYQRSGREPLLLTCVGQQEVNTDVLKVLVEHMRVDLVAVDQDGANTLHRLFRGGRTSGHWWQNFLALPYLVKHGAQINATDNIGRTPLHLALDRFGHIDFNKSTIENLIALGANVNAADKYGRTCLCRAAGNIHHFHHDTLDNQDSLHDSNKLAVGLTETLLRHGALVTQPSIVEAIRRDNGFLLDMLLSPSSDHNTDPNTRHREDQMPHGYWWTGTTYSLGGDADEEPWRYKPPLAINAVPESVMYPLHYAAMQHNTRIIKTLLSYGADPNARYENGMTILHYVISQQDASCGDAGFAVIDLLLDHHADKTTTLETRNPLGMTLLLIAACSAGKVQPPSTSHPEAGLSETGHMWASLLNRLLDLGADVQARDNAGRNALYHLGDIYQNIESSGSSLNSTAGYGPLARRIWNLNRGVLDVS